MRKILKVQESVGSNDYTMIDSVGRKYTVNTDRLLRKGQSVLTVNGVVTGIVQAATPDVYEV